MPNPPAMPSVNSPDESTPLHLGRVTLFRRESRVVLDNRPVTLGPRSFDLLMALARRPGRLMSKDELLELVWPGQEVEEGNIAVQVCALRKALGDGLIATVPGRGYRLTIPIDALPAANAAPSPLRRRTDIAGPEASPGLLTRLPSALPPLLGRADDCAQLASMVEQHRLVSVVGPGGIGKTLLVQHLLDARRATYRHGVCWVELATLTDAATVPDAIMAALGVQPGGGDAMHRLATAMAPLQILLALDNAEHLLEPVRKLVEVLLRVAPGVRLVVTSQAPLHAAGEHRYRLGVLDVPAGPVGVGDALRAGAVALFVERARAADARFVLTDANVAAVVEVCRRLDGLPLAIELAAARAPALGFHRLAASMNDRLAFLGAAHGASAPDRQRTLRATLDWSHSLLGDIEQAVFRRMAVVAGSASMEFIQEVASDDPGGAIDRLVVLDALCVLVERSLVSIVEVAGTELPRYALLESPRVYALEQLTQRGELERTQCRHVQACVQAVGLLGDALESGGLGLEEWRRRLTPDVANSRDAMAHAGLLGDVDSAARIGMALVRALPKSMFAERMAIGDTLSELLGSHVSEGLKLRGWIELAKLWSNTSRQDRARALWERALAAARSMDPVPESRVLLHAALAGSVYAAASIGDVDGATERHEEMRALEDPAWPPGRLVVGLQAAKYLANARGDAGERLQLARRMHATMVAAGMDENVGILNMVNAQIFAGRAEAAVETATALVGVLTAGRDEFTLCVARNTLVSALLETADVARARNEARPGWEAAMRFDLWTKWMDMLSLLCALELRPRSAALLLGMVMAHPEAAVGDPEEAARCERIGRLSLSALGEDAFSALLQQGAALRIDEVSELAFGLVDAVDVVT